MISCTFVKSHGPVQVQAGPDLERLGIDLNQRQDIDTQAHEEYELSLYVLHNPG